MKLAQYPKRSILFGYEPISADQQLSVRVSLFDKAFVGLFVLEQKVNQISSARHAYHLKFWVHGDLVGDDGGRVCCRRLPRSRFRLGQLPHQRRHNAENTDHHYNHQQAHQPSKAPELWWFGQVVITVAGRAGLV